MKLAGAHSSILRERRRSVIWIGLFAFLGHWTSGDGKTGGRSCASGVMQS
jgi:hypothetical protein